MSESLLNSSDLTHLWKHRGDRNYDLKSFISDGAFIRYMLFEDSRTKQDVVGKIVTAPREGEAYHWSTLQHENLLPLLEVVSVNKKVSVYMSPLIGRNLKVILHDELFMNDPGAFMRKKAYVEDILWALDYLQGKSLCILNLTDLVVIVSEVSDKAMLCDFSHVFFIERAKKEGINLPTLYQAPELKFGKFDPISVEIWACGVMILEVFTAHYVPSAFIGDEVHQILQAAQEVSCDTLREANPASQIELLEVQELKSFLKLFLVKDPKQRASFRISVLSSFLKDAQRFTSNETGCKVSFEQNRNFKKRLTATKSNRRNSHIGSFKDPFADIYKKEIENCRKKLKKVPPTNKFINLEFVPDGDNISKYKKANKCSTEARLKDNTINCKLQQLSLNNKKSIDQKPDDNVSGDFINLKTVTDKMYANPPSSKIIKINTVKLENITNDFESSKETINGVENTDYDNSLNVTEACVNESRKKTLEGIRDELMNPSDSQSENVSLTNTMECFENAVHKDKNLPCKGLEETNPQILKEHSLEEKNNFERNSEDENFKPLDDSESCSSKVACLKSDVTNSFLCISADVETKHSSFESNNLNNTQSSSVEEMDSEDIGVRENTNQFIEAFSDNKYQNISNCEETSEVDETENVHTLIHKAMSLSNISPLKSNKIQMSSLQRSTSWESGTFPNKNTLVNNGPALSDTCNTDLADIIKNESFSEPFPNLYENQSSSAMTTLDDTKEIIVSNESSLNYVNLSHEINNGLSEKKSTEMSQTPDNGSDLNALSGNTIPEGSEDECCPNIKYQENQVINNAKYDRCDTTDYLDTDDNAEAVESETDSNNNPETTNEVLLSSTTAQPQMNSASDSNSANHGQNEISKLNTSTEPINAHKKHTDTFVSSQIVPFDAQAHENNEFYIIPPDMPMYDVDLHSESDECVKLTTREEDSKLVTAIEYAKIGLDLSGKDIQPQSDAQLDTKGCDEQIVNEREERETQMAAVAEKKGTLKPRRIRSFLKLSFRGKTPSVKEKVQIEDNKSKSTRNISSVGQDLTNEDNAIMKSSRSLEDITRDDATKLTDGSRNSKKKKKWWVKFLCPHVMGKTHTMEDLEESSEE